MEPHSHTDQETTPIPGRAKPATVGMTIMLIIGGIILGVSLALNFFLDYFSVLMFVVGIVLIGVAVAYLIVNAFKDDPQDS